MLRICAYWETVQMAAALDWRMWRQIKGAFGVTEFHFCPVKPKMARGTFSQWPDMATCLAGIPDDSPRVFLEPHGNISPAELFSLAPEGMTLVLGSTLHGNAELARPQDTLCRIATPEDVDLYGHNAAAIALAFWAGQ